MYGSKSHIKTLYFVIQYIGCNGGQSGMRVLKRRAVGIEIVSGTNGYSRTKFYDVRRRLSQRELAVACGMSLVTTGRRGEMVEGSRRGKVTGSRRSYPNTLRE